MTNEGYAPMVVRVATKKRLDNHKQKGESYSDQIERILDENEKIVVEA